MPTEAVLETFKREMGAVTPKVGGNGAIINDVGQVLLVKRSDNGRWCLPGGYAEVGLTPQENVAREVREETGPRSERWSIYSAYRPVPGTPVPITSSCIFAR